jgi:hypothetical protein
MVVSVSPMVSLRLLLCRDYRAIQPVVPFNYKLNTNSKSCYEMDFCW